MPVDLDKIRALLASVEGFTPGPWGFGDDGLVWADGTPMDPICHTAPRIDSLLPDAPLIAAAPDLHRELTEAVGEIEGLRAQVERHIEGRIIAESAARTGLGEIERLRAHNARMVAQINALADECDAAAFTDDDEWATRAKSLRRLAAGEVDDG